jgi:3-oxoacyl-[acyl-carrier protein] reductase
VNLGLDGKTALVVGGGSGLGHAVALALAAEGANVVAAGRRADAVESTAELIASAGGAAVGVQLDLTDVGTFAPALAEARTRFGDVDILFNSGGGPPPTPAGGQPLDLWQRQFESIVLGVIQLTDLVVPGMKERGWGRIITNTSSGVIVPIPNLGLSNAFRLALVGWSKTLAREVAPDGITVNVVVPGRILTDRIRELNEAQAAREGTTTADVERASIASIPVGRYGDPAEYAATVAFLAGAQAAYITGSLIRVDGGAIPAI